MKWNRLKECQNITAELHFHVAQFLHAHER